jgi:hypothetical protein
MSAESLRRAKRLKLADGTVWPAPDADPAVIVQAYYDLLMHPWGANASCQKIRMLRRAYAAYVVPNE